MHGNAPALAGDHRLSGQASVNTRRPSRRVATRSSSNGSSAGPVRSASTRVQRGCSQRAQGSLLGGVPMHWMKKWAGKFPVFVAEAHGARLHCVDGLRYVDFCLGDTGAMTGHSPAPAVEAIAKQSQKGITLMLPTEDALWVGEELASRFGLPYWQFALTATDANRFAIRIARAITARPKILVFNYCYHGTVDESYITLDDHNQPHARAANIGPPVDPSVTTRVVEFNDLPALEAALAHNDVACILAEPALTNVGIVLPDPGFPAALRKPSPSAPARPASSTKRTPLRRPRRLHRAAQSPARYLRRSAKRSPAEFPRRPTVCPPRSPKKSPRTSTTKTADTGGIGGTLAANALSLAAMRATLEKVLTPDRLRSHGSTRSARGPTASPDPSRERDFRGTSRGSAARAEYLFRPTVRAMAARPPAQWTSNSKPSCISTP